MWTLRPGVRAPGLGLPLRPSVTHSAGTLKKHFRDTSPKGVDHMDLGRRLTREEDGNNPGRRAVSLTCTNEFFFITLGKGRSVAFQHAATGASPWRVRPPRQRSGVHSRQVDGRAWAGEVRGRGFLRHRKQRLYFRGRLCQADGHLRGHLLSGGQWERGRRPTYKCANGKAGVLGGAQAAAESVVGAGKGVTRLEL